MSRFTDNYKKELDNIQAPDSLKAKILEMKDNADLLPAPEEKPKKIVSIFSSNSGKRRKKAIIAVAACLAVIVILGPAAASVSGSIAGTKNYTKDIMPVEGNQYSYAADQSSSVSLFTKSNGFSGTNYDSEDNLADAIDTSDINAKAVDTTKKIIKNANISLDTEKYNDTIDNINKQIDLLGCNITQFNESAYSQSYGWKRANFTIAVPAEKFDEFITALQDFGTIQSKYITADDVTDSYSELESEINALKSEETTLLSILEGQTDLDGILRIQDRLTEIRSSIDEKTKRIDRYDKQVAFSTVELVVEEVEREEVDVQKGIFDKIKDRFGDNLYNVGQFFGNLFIGLVAGIPYWITIAVIVAVVVLIIKKIKKNKIKKLEKLDK